MKRAGLFPNVRFGHAVLSPQGFVAPNNSVWTVPARHHAGRMLFHHPGPVVALHSIPPVMKMGGRMAQPSAGMRNTPTGGGLNGS